MPKICYQDIRFRPGSLTAIDRANAIIAEYAAQGFQLTLRQLYYQHVARGFIPNNDKEYKKLGELINAGRLAGLIDWGAIVDRTRNLQSLGHWGSPASIILSAADSFHLDKWAEQPFRVEVWVEKDALVGVIEGICTALDVPYFACRGYVSQSEMWAAAQRLRRYERGSQHVYILHLGDHDPSGVDMTRDIQERLELFGSRASVRRLALNFDQVRQYNPPPNSAKVTDSRSDSYIDKYGDESWELDALEPTVLAALIDMAVRDLRDDARWADEHEREDRYVDLLRRTAAHWLEVADHVDSLDGKEQGDA